MWPTMASVGPPPVPGTRAHTEPIDVGRHLREGGGRVGEGARGRGLVARRAGRGEQAAQDVRDRHGRGRVLRRRRPPIGTERDAGAPAPGGRRLDAAASGAGRTRPRAGDLEGSRRDPGPRGRRPPRAAGGARGGAARGAGLRPGGRGRRRRRDAAPPAPDPARRRRRSTAAWATRTGWPSAAPCAPSPTPRRSSSTPRSTTTGWPTRARAAGAFAAVIKSADVDALFDTVRLAARRIAPGAEG